MDKAANKPRQQGDSRELLIQVARQLFASKGYSATTIRDIVDKAGLNVSLISYHFGGKEALYREVLKGLANKEEELIIDTLGRPDSRAAFEQQILSYIEASIGDAVVDPSRISLMSREFDNHSPVFQELMGPIFLKAIEGMVAFWAHAKEKGFITSDSEPIVVGNLLYSCIHNTVRMDRIRQAATNRTIQNPDNRRHLCQAIHRLFIGKL